jgi:predicted GIY-YIG superfamily endonuclease
MSEKTYSIYALRNKVFGEVGYIGQTKNLDQRFKEHLAQIYIESILYE